MALSNADYNQIMRVYSQRQTDDEKEQQRRIREVREKIPELARLDEAVREASLATFNAMQQGDKEAIRKLRNQTRYAAEKRKALLRESGLPLDYLEMHYTCPDCKDTGYIHHRKCHCFTEMESRFLYKQSNIREIVERQNFNKFNLNIFDNSEIVDINNNLTNRAYMRKTRNDLESFCRNFDREHGNVILMGKPGTGKTFLINCVAKALMDSFHSVLYLTSTDFFESLSKSTFTREEGADDMSNAILDCDLLVIDDLGTEMTNSFTASKLFYVLNQRMVYHRSVIISTNLNFKTMRECYSDRVVSRIMADYLIIPLYGNDLRLR